MIARFVSRSGYDVSHFGVLGVLVIPPVCISFGANRCKNGKNTSKINARVCKVCAFVAFLAHYYIFWHAFPCCSITGGTRLNTIGLAAHALITWKGMTRKGHWHFFYASQHARCTLRLH